MKNRPCTGILHTSVFALLCVVSASLSAFAGTDSERRAGASAGSDLAVWKGDSLTASLRFKEAITLLEAENKARPSNPEILWRLANLMINVGDVADDNAKDAYYNRSVAYAEAAVRADPANANAHAYLAAALGSHAMFAGGREKVKLAYRIKDELDRALVLDGANQVAHTIYGTWHREIGDVSWIERQLAHVLLGGMPDGSFEESVRHLREAIRFGPDVLRHRYELGRTYLAMGRSDLAARSYQDALRCPLSRSTDAQRKQEIREYFGRK